MQLCDICKRLNNVDTPLNTVHLSPQQVFVFMNQAEETVQVVFLPEFALLSCLPYGERTDSLMEQMLTPPEMFKNRDRLTLNQKADIFTTARNIYELATGVHFFDETCRSEGECFRALAEGKIAEKVRSAHSDLVLFLALSPEDRPSADRLKEVVESMVFKDVE